MGNFEMNEQERRIWLEVYVETLRLRYTGASAIASPDTMAREAVEAYRSANERFKPVQGHP